MRELFAQEVDARPEWFRQALSRMKEKKLHGVVVLAPPADPAQLEQGRRLWDLLDEGTPEAHELFLTGVFIVMTPALADASGVRKPDEKENRFLLDPEGARVAVGVSDAKAFDTSNAFVSSFGPFLFGESGERLKARAEELQAGAPRDIPAAMVDLGADDLDKREQASRTLLHRASELAPLYAWKRKSSTDPEVAARLRSIIDQHFMTLAKDRPGARLPFGTRVPKFAESGCGGRVELAENQKEDSLPTVDCGMARMDDSKVRMFLRFLTK